MADLKSVLAIGILMMIVGGIIGLVYWNIQKDAEKQGNGYDIQPDAGEDIEVVEDEEVLFVGRNLAKDTDYPEVIYQWDFDNDGDVDWEDDKAGAVKYTYHVADNYMATFTIKVISGRSEQSASDTRFVTVLEKSMSNTKPVAKFTVSSQEVQVGETVQFSAIQSTDIEDGTNLEFSWDFDNDGIEDSTDREAFFSYAYPGEFLATLEVADSGGKSDSESTTIYVTEEETPDKRKIELENEGNGSIGPNNPFSDSEVVLNWDMTDEFMEGLKKVEVVLVWEDLTWDLDISFGKGENSGNGDEYDRDEGGSEGAGEGNVTTYTDDEDHLQYDTEEQWFLAVTTKEATKSSGSGTKSLGDKCDFSVSVTLWYV